jgi:hypothetical protein
VSLLSYVFLFLILLRISPLMCIRLSVVELMNNSSSFVVRSVFGLQVFLHIAIKLALRDVVIVCFFFIQL